MALFNVGQLWECSKISDEYINWELSELLELDGEQVKKIQAINLAFNSKKEKISIDKWCTDEVKERTMEHLTAERSQQIVDVLNEEQQKVLYAYSTSLLPYNSLIE